jgi:hypothetical protein
MTLDTDSIRRKLYETPKIRKLTAEEITFLQSQAAEGNTEAKELLDFLIRKSPGE